NLIIGIPVFFTIFYRLASTTVADPDLWGYMAFGRLFREGGSFPYHDIFSYMPTRPVWIYHEWLTGVLFFKLYQLSGETGLQLFRYSIGLLTAGIVYLTARKRGAGPLSSAIALWMVSPMFGIFYSSVRATIFTYLFFVITFYLLETARLRNSWRRLLFIIPIQILWCNLHGGFFAGLGLVSLYTAGQILSRHEFKRHLIILFLSTVATLMNPYGISYWVHMAEAITMPRPEIGEWLSVYKAITLDYQTGNQFYFIIVVFISIMFGLWYRWKEITPILIFLTTIYLGFKSNRHQVFFFLSFAIFYPSILMAFGVRLKSDPKILKLLNRVDWKTYLLVLASIISLHYRVVEFSPLELKLPTCSTKKEPFYYPLGAIDYVREHNLAGNMLCEFDWGEYILWNLYPKCLVGMDGRYESVYPAQITREYFDFDYGRNGWRRFLENYPHDMILIKSKGKTCSLLQAENNWMQLYEDDGCVLFVRRDYRLFQ
ncbi:MAG: hypothetical protein U0586_05500, partial [Candidatus Brocadiaceae bacterium]